MTPKSRRKRGKQPPSRKGKSRQHTTTAARVPAAREAAKSIARPDVPPPPATTPRQSTRPQIIQHPYVAGELRTIGILAGIMLIILIVLYLVLA